MHTLTSQTQVGTLIDFGGAVNEDDLDVEYSAAREFNEETAGLHAHLVRECVCLWCVCVVCGAWCVCEEGETSAVTHNSERNTLSLPFF